MNQTVTAAPSIRVQTNTNRLIANLGVVFSSADKVIAEIMQNARRAQATYVTFSQVGPVLMVRDNGIGVDNMQVLLHIAESGWDEETIARENSYGMGWLSTLFAADKVRVESKGKQVAFDTTHAIEGKEIAVSEAFLNEGTRITLTGFKLNTANTLNAITKYAKGFPIRVIFNGEEVERPHALENLNTVQTEIGHIHLAGMHNDYEPTSSFYSLYFQGLPVSAGYGYNHDGKNIVHLDSSFKVRMPDRDTVIGCEEARERIKAAAKHAWKEYLEACKQMLTSEEFVGYWPAIHDFDLHEILNDVPVLPAVCFKIVAEDPHQRAHDTPMYGHSAMVYQSDVASKKHIVVSQSYIGIEDFDGQGFAALKIGFDNDWLFLDKTLDSGHWIYQHALDIDTVGIKVDYTELQRQPYSCAWPEGEIVLVENYTITVGDHSHVVQDWALVLNEDGESGHDDHRIIIVPQNSSGAEASSQICSHMDDNEDYREDWDESAAKELSAQVAVMRGEPAKVTILKALKSESVEYKEHCFKSVVVAVVKDKAKVETHDLLDILKQFGAELCSNSGNIFQDEIDEKASAFISEMLQVEQ